VGELYKYVIADDEALIRRGIVSKIGKIDIDLVCAGQAGNGNQALELIEKEKPHILLTDMKMPVLDGVTLLKAMRQRHPQVKVIVISGFTDFEYTHEAIESNVIAYLLKPYDREKLRDALQKAISQINQDQVLEKDKQHVELEKQEVYAQADLEHLLQLFTHSNASFREFKSHAYRRLLAWEGYRIAWVHAPSLSLMAELSRLLSQEEPGIRQVVLSHPADPTGLLLIFAADRTGHDVTPLPITNVQANTEGVRIGISGLKAAWAELPAACREAEEALNGRLLQGKERIHYFEDVRNPGIPVDWDRTDELLFFLETGNGPASAKLLDQLFSFIRSQPEFKLSAVKHYFRMLTEKIRLNLNEQVQIITDQMHSASFESAIQGCLEIEQIESYMRDLTVRVVRFYAEFGGKANLEFVQQIQTFVRQHYDKEMSLDKISEMFYKHPNYISTVFKEKTGENFTDYVNHVRIAKAQDLLSGTSLKVEKIAKQLGYDNTKYFYRIFKKKTGMTPLEYRTLKGTSRST
jgi:two-component system response regulator YesN